MEKIEIYKLSDGMLCIEIFKDVSNENSTYLFKGNEATTIINKLKNQKIRGVAINPEIDEIIIFYKEGIVRLNEYSKIQYKPGIRYLKEEIKKHEETKSLEKHKNKKVKRKNKHLGVVIVSTTLAAVMLVTGATIAISQNIDNEKQNIISPSVVQVLEEPTLSYQSDKVDYFSETQGSDIVSIDYEDRSQTEKANYAKENYLGLIEKYSKMYGLDPTLVLAIATQERGIHSSVMDEGGATGLMQIQNGVWEYYDKTSYNFETGEYETFCITPDKIQDLEQNIKIGCTIFQECLQNMDYNILAAIQCYNMGQGSMDQILSLYSMDTGKSIKEILNNPQDIGWLEYRSIIPYGDQNYVENVLSWIGDKASLTVMKENNEIVSLNINNKTNEKNRIIC